MSTILQRYVAMSCNELQDDWGINLLHIGFVSNEIHIGRISCLPLAVSDRLYGGAYQSSNLDQLVYCTPACERQQRAYEIVRVQHALTIARVDGRDSVLFDAFLRRPKYVAGGCAWV